MPDILKDIPELHYTHCPLCGQERLTIVKGKSTFLGLAKEPDEIRCTNCETRYETDDGQIYIRLLNIPAPYSFFADSLSGPISDGQSGAGMAVKLHAPFPICFFFRLTHFFLLFM